jgi:hypothetical protein
MTNHIRLFAATAFLLAAAVSAAAQHSAMPKGMTHEEHLAQLQKEAEMKQRGAGAMGFDQDATIHHFRLSEDGGSVDVEVRRAGDAALRDAVRAHLREIAVEFAAGDFGKPFATHGEVPPGVPDLVRLKGSITYVFEDLKNGGRVRIRASTTAARDAVHAFLKYQIREHAPK